MLTQTTNKVPVTIYYNLCTDVLQNLVNIGELSFGSLLQVGKLTV